MGTVSHKKLTEWWSSDTSAEPKIGMKCGSQTICLSLAEEDWDYCDDEEKDSDCKDFTLLVIGLHFDISIPINKSLTAKPGVEVYWNYAKIFESWCNNLMQCVLNGNSYTALDLNHWIIPSLHILWTLLLATWYLFSYLIWYKAMLHRHGIESSLLIQLFYLSQRQGCLAEKQGSMRNSYRSQHASCINFGWNKQLYTKVQ